MGSRNSQKSKWITLAVLLAAALACVLVPPLRQRLGRVFGMLSSMDVEQVVAFIRSYGPWAAAISFCLMILQSVVAPLPAFLITFANAAIFGWQLGALLSWSSAMAGAALCFGIAHVLGRDTVEKLTSKTALKSVDVFFDRYGKHTILVCRLLPFVSFDLVSYAAGLTSIRFWPFFIATGLGQLPATIVYSYVGGMLTGGIRLFVMGLLTLFALTIIAFVSRRIYSERYAAQPTSSDGEDL